jgi:hypothetical protein
MFLYIQFLLLRRRQRNNEFDEKTHMEQNESQKPYILLKKNAEKALFSDTKFKNNTFRVIFFIFMILFGLKTAFRKDLINMLNIINEKMGKVL